MSRYSLFDRSAICLRALAERQNQTTLVNCPAPGQVVAAFQHPDLPTLGTALAAAKTAGRSAILMMGAHVIKQGMSRYLIDLMERGLITHLATNGAGVIHDFELSRVGGTSEDVAHYIKQGDFGMWRETGDLNEIVKDAAARGEGVAEAVGRIICEERFPNRDVSLCGSAYRLGIPMTSHVGIGADIIHAHPNCDGSAWGAASYTDFLMFTQAVTNLEGGVYLNVGSAVTGPEVYLKALSMARNVASRRGESIAHFTTTVFDLIALDGNHQQGTPPKSHPQYYYRPWKTILVRTVADGGTSFYIQGDHRETLPALHREALHADAEQSARRRAG
jgi:hypothetical protein